MLTNKLTDDIYWGQSKAYSTSTYSKSVKENEFYEWFCGLTDGEGSFLISTIGRNYTFAFKVFM